MTIAVASLMAGCTTIRNRHGYMVDNTVMSSVLPGVDNRQSVRQALGQPTFTSEFGQQDWYYLSLNTRQKPFTRPKTSDETIWRVRFDAAGNVLAVDKSGMDHVARINPVGDKTPTLGRKRGILQDLFGNIGAVGGMPAGGGAGAGGQ